MDRETKPPRKPKEPKPPARPSYDTAAENIDKWVNSPGLQRPK